PPPRRWRVRKGFPGGRNARSTVSSPTKGTRGVSTSNRQTCALMVPAEFQTFFLASSGASAALIGLLFVAVSIAPERVFGTQAEAVHQAQALSAFTALANVFFISMASLVPGIAIGIVVTIVAIPASLQTLALLALFNHWRAEGIA